MERIPLEAELNIGQKTHEGMSGKRNEDSLGVFAWRYDRRHKLVLGVVADGVGGQIAGEIASRLAVDTIGRYFDGLERIDNISKHLEQAILQANDAVYKASQDNPEYRGMSTTVAVNAILDDYLFIAHVGDSRIYLFRDGRLRQISTDHTWAQEAIEAGLLTPEQAKKHPNRNVIRRHLGGSPEVEVDHRLILEPGQSAIAARSNQGMIIREGDTLLICSDGLTDMINDQSVHETLLNHYFDLTAAANELIEKANQAGGKDNITVVLLQAPPKGPPPVVMPGPPVTTRTAAPAVAMTAAAAATGGAGAASRTGTRGSGGKLAILLIGGIVVVFLIVAVVAGVFLISSSGDGGTTPEATALPAIIPDEATFEPGAPATAAFLTTESGGLGTIEGSSPVDTPGLIPTLRETLSPTDVGPGITPQPTATPTTLIVPSNTPSSGGQPQRTRTKSPTETAEPAPTPEPTSTPPLPTATSQPPTATAEPPTNTPEPPGNTPEATKTLSPGGGPTKVVTTES